MAGHGKDVLVSEWNGEWTGIPFGGRSYYKPTRLMAQYRVANRRLKSVGDSFLGELQTEMGEPDRKLINCDDPCKRVIVAKTSPSDRFPTIFVLHEVDHVLSSDRRFFNP